MKDEGTGFPEAVRDYFQFAGRGYPDKALIKLIGDRYRLSGSERSKLLRGIFPEEHNRARQARLAAVEEVRGKDLAVDGFNVLYTIISYLSGREVYLATDGLLRDASETHGKPYRKELRHRAWRLSLKYLTLWSPSHVHIYFDEPISYSGEMARIASADLFAGGLRGTARTVASADHWVSHASKGLIASSDTVVIDTSPLRVFDMARHILEAEFDARPFPLSGLLHEVD